MTTKGDVQFSAVFDIKGALDGIKNMSKGFMGLGQSVKKVKTDDTFKGKSIENFNSILIKIEKHLEVIANRFSKFHKENEKLSKLQNLMQRSRENFDKKDPMSSKKLKDKEKQLKDMGKSSSGLSVGLIAMGNVLGNVVTSGLGMLKQGLMDSIPAIGQTFSNIQQTIFRNIASPIAKEVMPLLVKISNWVRDNRKGFVTFGVMVMTVFKAIGGLAMSVFKLLKSGFDAFMGGVGKLQISMSKVFQYFNLIMFKASIMIAYILILLEPIVKNIGKAFSLLYDNAIKPFFDGFGEAMDEDLVPFVTDLGNLLKDVSDTIKELFGGLSGSKGIFKDIGYIVGKVIFGSLRNMVKMGGVILSLFRVVFLGKPIGEFKGKVIELRDSILNMFKSILDRFGGFTGYLTNGFIYIKTKVNGIIDSIKNTFNDGWQYIKDKFEIVSEFINEKWLEAMDMFKLTIKKIKKFFRDLWESAIGYFNEFASKLKGNFVWDWISNKISGLSNIISKINSAMDKVSKKKREMRDDDLKEESNKEKEKTKYPTYTSYKQLSKEQGWFIDKFKETPYYDTSWGSITSKSEQKALQIFNRNAKNHEIGDMDFEMRAKGGKVNANTPYIVGEKGMEVFVPRQNGYIIPNNKIENGITKTTTKADIDKPKPNSSNVSLMSPNEIKPKLNANKGNSQANFQYIDNSHTHYTINTNNMSEIKQAIESKQKEKVNFAREYFASQTKYGAMG